MLLCALVALAVLSFPVWYRRVFGLETGEPRGEDLLRWAFWLAVVFLTGGVARSDARAVLWKDPWFRFWLVALPAAGYVEILSRAVLKYGAGPVARRIPWVAKLLLYVTDNPDNLYYSRYVPHPFLQFTGPRNRLPGNEEDYLLGFKDLRLSDLPKPADTIRVACLGGSTTEDGYPELLQAYFAQVVRDRRFQVLNFGTTWWSSIHSVVNYALNVRDFKPDYLVVHDNCCDHHYRGFPGLRGDAAHAYRVFLVPRSVGEPLYRFCVPYRLLRIVLVWLAPEVFTPRMAMADVGLQPGKTFRYQPEELRIFRRNIETLCTLAQAEKTVICLATMPISATRTFGDEHDRAYRPHNRDANDVLRQIARERRAVLVDFEQIMAGHEEYFRDAVHCTPDGNRRKAEEVGRVILALESKRT